MFYLPVTILESVKKAILLDDPATKMMITQKRVDINYLIPTQDRIDKELLEDRIEQFKDEIETPLELLSSWDSKYYYVIDGHHRVIAATRIGKYNLPAYILETNRFSQYENGLKNLPIAALGPQGWHQIKIESLYPREFVYSSLYKKIEKSKGNLKELLELIPDAPSLEVLRESLNRLLDPKTIPQEGEQIIELIKSRFGLTLGEMFILLTTIPWKKELQEVLERRIRRLKLIPDPKIKQKRVFLKGLLLRLREETKSTSATDR